MPFSSVVAAEDDRDALRVGGEEHRRLAGGVAGADDVHVEPCVFGASLRAAPYETPFPASRSSPSSDSCRHETPHARMIVCACETSPPSRNSCGSPASIRSIARVTRISAPSLRACWSARLASSSPERQPGTRGSSRCGTTFRPGRRAPHARSRSSAGAPTRCAPLQPARRVRRRQSPRRTGSRPALSRGQQLRDPTQLRFHHRFPVDDADHGSRPLAEARRPLLHRVRLRRAEAR